MMTEELSTKDDGLDPILAQDDKKALTVLTDLWNVVLNGILGSLRLDLTLSTVHVVPSVGFLMLLSERSPGPNSRSV